MTRESDDAADAVILDRLATGEREAPMAELYERYARRVYGLGLRLLGDANQAEELVQETFVRLWQGAGRYDRTQGAVASWVWMIARGAAIDMQRRAAARPRAVDGRAGREPSTTDEVERIVLSIDVREALENLSHDHREVLALGYDEGLTQREIAARLDIPLGTVKTRTYHALRALKDRLDQEELR